METILIFSLGEYAIGRFCFVFNKK